MTRIRTVLLSLLVLTALVVTACGGDDDESSGSGSGSEDSTESTADNGEDDGSEDSSDVDDFASALQKGKNVEFDATYETRQEGSTEVSTFRVAQKKPKSLFESTQGESTSTIINDGTDNYVCSKSGTEPATCMKQPGNGANSLAGAMFALVDPGAIATTLRGLGSIPGIDVERSSKTYAGEDTNCVTVHVEGEGDANDGTWCVTESGVLAYTETGGSIVELTEFKTDVDDSAFELPGDVEG